MKRFISVLCCMALLCALSFCRAETVVGDPQKTLLGKTITWQGNTYRLRRRIHSILLMGVDRWEDERAAEKAYRQGGQADFQLIVVIDDDDRTVSLLQLNRDAMAVLTVLNILGQTIGSQTAQICLAYSYGDGGPSSGKLALEAASRYLMDTPLEHYYAVSLDAISALNDLLGGIEVTLEDDFSVYDAGMTPGTALRLQGKQAEYYVRNRYYVGDGSNAARMKRQQDYLEKAKEEMIRRMHASQSFVLDVFDALAEYTVTDVNRGFIINMANKASKYDVQPIRQISGETVVGESGYVEFYADEESLMEAVLSIFYRPL